LLPSKVTRKPVAKPNSAVRGRHLAATGVPAAPVALALALIVGALLGRRAIRRT